MLGLVSGCTDSLELGSNVLWSAEHEQGTLAEWTADEGGKSYVVGAESSVDLIVDPTARSDYVVRLRTTDDIEAEPGAGLWRVLEQPEPAYYGAHFYLPQALPPSTSLTLLRFRSTIPEEVSDEFMGVDVSLRSTPTGEVLLSLIHQRQAYLTSALPEPTPFVPLQRWFELEVRFHHALNATGLIRVWLDGRLVYDVSNRVTAETERLYFTACNVPTLAAQASITLYLDDVVLSRSRITPLGSPDD